MNERSRKVQEAIEHVRNLCESADRLMRVEDKAILLSIGVPVSESDSSSDNEDALDIVSLRLHQGESGMDATSRLIAPLRLQPPVPLDSDQPDTYATS